MKSCDDEWSRDQLVISWSCREWVGCVRKRGQSLPTRGNGRVWRGCWSCTRRWWLRTRCWWSCARVVLARVRDVEWLRAARGRWSLQRPRSGSVRPRQGRNSPRKAQGVQRSGAAMMLSTMIDVVNHHEKHRPQVRVARLLSRTSKSADSQLSSWSACLGAAGMRRSAPSQKASDLASLEALVYIEHQCSTNIVKLQLVIARSIRQLQSCSERLRAGVELIFLVESFPHHSHTSVRVLWRWAGCLSLSTKMSKHVWPRSGVNSKATELARVPMNVNQDRQGSGNITLRCLGGEVVVIWNGAKMSSCSWNVVNHISWHSSASTIDTKVFEVAMNIGTQAETV